MSDRSGTGLHVAPAAMIELDPSCLLKLQIFLSPGRRSYDPQKGAVVVTILDENSERSPEKRESHRQGEARWNRLPIRRLIDRRNPNGQIQGNVRGVAFEAGFESQDDGLAGRGIQLRQPAVQSLIGL